MSKQIPIYFDSVIIASPVEPLGSNPSLGRLNVGVFTKYGNRNGSYITDEVAEQLIESATKGNTPVVGFFDPETKDWAGHTGPTGVSCRCLSGLCLPDRALQVVGVLLVPESAYTLQSASHRARRANGHPG